MDINFDADCGDLLPTEKNELSHKFLKFLTKETKEYTYRKLSAEFKCNFEQEESNLEAA